MTIYEELTQAISLEQKWRKALNRTDSGSYCESPDYDYRTIQPIVAAYEQLTVALLNFDRSGIKGRND